MIDPVANEKIIDQDIADLPAIVIDPSEIRNDEGIVSEFSRSVEELYLPTPRPGGEKRDRGV
jgi:hypothetical protein